MYVQVKLTTVSWTLASLYKCTYRNIYYMYIMYMFVVNNLLYSFDRNIHSQHQSMWRHKVHVHSPSPRKNWGNHRWILRRTWAGSPWCREGAPLSSWTRSAGWRRGTSGLAYWSARGGSRDELGRGQSAPLIAPTWAWNSEPSDSSGRRPICRAP